MSCDAPWGGDSLDCQLQKSQAQVLMIPMVAIILTVPHPEYDAYKHGAFLEKQDRFFKEKPSDIPGPGTYKVDVAGKQRAHAADMKPVSGDRSAVLQRRLEEVERLYAEQKKSHQAELERLKGELSRAQKTNAEQGDRYDKLKRQNEALDLRCAELKKINLADQSEIRDLRTKLRASEHERTQLSAKQGEAGEAKKSLQALDSRRRDELRERDRKIAELEKAVTVERKRKEALESKLTELKNNADAESRHVHDAKKALDVELRETKEENERTKASLLAFKQEVKDVEDELLSQLEQHKHLLSRVAEEYGRLATSSISLIEHERVKSQSRVLQLRVTRLERKLANSEGQVLELANLIRCTKDQNALLAAQVVQAEVETSYYADALRSAFAERPPLSSTREIDGYIMEIMREMRETQSAIQHTLLADAATWTTYEHLKGEHLLIHSRLLEGRLTEAQDEARRQSSLLTEAQAQLSGAAAELSATRSEYQTTQAKLVETLTSLSVSKAREETLGKELQSVKAQRKAETAKLEQQLRQEKEIAQKLASVVQTSKAAQDALRDEVEQLAADLTEAEKYQEAYISLLEEVDALVGRNALAEDEAQRLSKFNAEILGHQNPAQRIMYVDRIRGELHEAKLELLAVTRERDALLDNNDDLQHELGLYTSVGVPMQVKPRTTVTRVARAPLANQNINTSARAKSPGSMSSSNARKLESMPEVEYKEGDMTLDELSCMQD
ncbi:hypothetical protein EIP86_005060 [Pleurotus ostreatoroseus]|nr:hypothetical protein EIP86_005060 [Pleurotus ostreatoroseus]